MLNTVSPDGPTIILAPTPRGADPCRSMTVAIASRRPDRSQRATSSWNSRVIPPPVPPLRTRPGSARRGSGGPLRPPPRPRVVAGPQGLAGQLPQRLDDRGARRRRRVLESVDQVGDDGVPLELHQRTVGGL